MSLLQRPPLDVDATVGCEGRGKRASFEKRRLTDVEQVIYDTTTRLLSASTTLRPYAGAVIRRSVLVKPETMLAIEDNESTIFDGQVASLPFVAPINRAMFDWWARQPQAKTSTPTPIESTIDALELPIGWHIDQEICDDHGPALPTYGPLTAIAFYQGSATYKLDVKRNLECFTMRDAERINELYRDDNKHAPSRFAATIDATAGDLVLWTNIPPTAHSVETSPDRAAFGFKSGHIPLFPNEHANGVE